MLKRILTMLCIVMLLQGCSMNKNVVKDDLAPMIYVKDQLYMVQDSSFAIVEAGNIGEEICKLELILDGGEKPSQNGEANIYVAGTEIYEYTDKA